MQHHGTRRLETARLILRPFTMEDGPAVYQNWASDGQVTRYLTWPTHGSPEVSAAYVGWCVSSYGDPAFYQWGIELKETHQLIGSISSVHCEEALEAVELGWVLGRPWWGRGIMPEAAREVIRFFFEEVGANRICAACDTHNPQSSRVMQKAGMRYEGTMRAAGKNNQGIVDMAQYAILRKD